MGLFVGNLAEKMPEAGTKPPCVLGNRPDSTRALKPSKRNCTTRAGTVFRKEKWRTLELHNP
ncbi:MAG: hypothetical protein IJS09_06885 [Treponema sp.]|nr:hypothetical protein [Treponema sp.]